MQNSMGIAAEGILHKHPIPVQKGSTVSYKAKSKKKNPKKKNIHME